MFRRILSSFAGGSTEGKTSALQPHRTEIEFAFVLVEAGADNQLQWTLSDVAGSALEFGGSVLDITGSLVFVAFSGVMPASPHPRREEFVAHIISSHRVFVRVLHGRTSALVGNLGCETRMAYTAVPSHFTKLLRRLCELPRGEAAEWSPDPLPGE